MSILSSIATLSPSVVTSPRVVEESKVDRCATCDHWTVEEPPICPICRSGLGESSSINSNENRIIRLACSHTFHEECFSGYERHLPPYNSLACPVCRRRIPRMNGEGRPDRASLAGTPDEEIEEMEQAILESRSLQSQRTTAVERLNRVSSNPRRLPTPRQIRLVDSYQSEPRRPQVTHEPQVRHQPIMGSMPWDHEDYPYLTTSRRMNAAVDNRYRDPHHNPHRYGINEPLEYSSNPPRTQPETTHDRIFGGYGGPYLHGGGALLNESTDFNHKEKRHIVPLQPSHRPFQNRLKRRHEKRHFTHDHSSPPFALTAVGRSQEYFL